MDMNILKNDADLNFNFRGVAMSSENVDGSFSCIFSEQTK